jgi:beta-phosphoglucomutase-like phosphatase (HAD superfamily)
MGFAPSNCAAIDDGLVGVEVSVKAGLKTYFYNVYQEPCDWPEVIGFNFMHELPGLIAHNHVTNSASSAPDTVELRRL